MVADPPGDPTSLFSVAGKRVVVTGGSRGIGLMIARGFVQAGAQVLITARNADACATAADELGAFGHCHAVAGDVTDSDGIAALKAAVVEQLGGLDVLVNNAGATWGAPLAEFPDHAFDKVFGTNVRALFRLSVEFLDVLKLDASPDDPGRIINIGSVDGIRTAVTDNYAYAASKAAVHTLTRQIALRLAGEAITVNAIAPGPFDSKMMAFLLDNESTRKLVADHVPMGRVGRPDDVAGAAIYLASRAGAYLTGVILPVDGGISAR